MDLDVRTQSADDTAKTFGASHFREAYRKGINVSQLLERMDPTENKPETDRTLDAFERVLKAAGIVTNPMPEFGVRPSTWEQATDTGEKRAMMVEWAARMWRQTTTRQMVTPTTRAVLLSGDAGLNTIANQYADNLAPRAKRLVPPVPIEAIVARTTPIDTNAYRTLYITDDLNNDAYRMKRVAETADIPATTLVTGEHTIRINKYGRALLSSYEQLRRVPLDRIGFIISRMALQAEVDKVTDAMNVIINGDGNANTSAVVLTETGLDAAGVAGTLTLKALQVAKMRFTAAYHPTTVLGQEAAITQLLLLPIGTMGTTPLSLMAGNALGTIAPIDDMLAGGIRYGVTADAPALKLVLFDDTQCIERVVEIGGNVSEVDRFIQNQTQLFTLTEVEGYACVDVNAARILNIAA